MGVFGDLAETRARWHTVASSYGGFGGFGDELGFGGRHRDDRPDIRNAEDGMRLPNTCLLYTSPSPRDS